MVMEYICCVLGSGNCSTNILYSFVMAIDGHGIYSMNWFNKISSRLQRICPEVERLYLTLCTLRCFSLLPLVLLEACSNKHRVLFFCTSKKQAHVFTFWYDSCHIIMFTYYKELQGIWCLVYRRKLDFKCFILFLSTKACNTNLSWCNPVTVWFFMHNICVSQNVL
jgi:hypothetical protein